MENFLSALEGLIDVNLLREVSTYQYNEDRADGGGFGLAEAEAAAAAGGGDGGVRPQVWDELPLLYRDKSDGDW